MQQENKPPQNLQHDHAVVEGDMPADPPLPPIAAKADDLESLKKTVEDAASAAATVWFSYIFVLFYIAVSAGGVTHVDLLLQRPVKLPFLNVELPLTAFFLFVPIIFVIVHVYVLMHFVLLGRKAKRFHEELITQIPDSGSKENQAASSKKRDRLRGQLPSNLFVQFLAGSYDIREGLFGLLLRLIVNVTLVIGPMILLILLQIVFLPYHDIYITWTQRIILITDIVITQWLWQNIVSGRGNYRRLFNWKAPATSVVSATLCFSIILFSICVIALPEETLPAGPAWFSSKRFWIFSPNKFSQNKLPQNITIRSALFEGPINCIDRRRQSLFSNTLILTGIDLNKELKIDDSKKIDKQLYSFILRGRNFDHAIMDFASLEKIDLSGANLKEASFYGASLEGVNMYKADLQGASLQKSHLEGASLKHAHLEGADLDNSYLEGATLNYAYLQGASLDNSHLEGASLVFASLDISSLSNSHLEGVDLSGASLEAASLRSANLQGSILHSDTEGDAKLKATDLSDAWLWRAVLPKKMKIYAEFDMHLEAGISDYKIDPFETKNIKYFHYDEEEYNRAERMLIHPSWTEDDYTELKNTLSDKIINKNMRDQALRRISRLDCDREDLLPCKDSETMVSKNLITPKAELIKQMNYKNEIVEKIKTIICGKDENAEFILRSILVRNRDEYMKALRNILSQGTCKLSNKIPASLFPVTKNKPNPKRFVEIESSCLDDE